MVVRRSSVLFITLAAAINCAYASKAIPALFWSPHRSLNPLPEVSGIKTINTDDFLKNYLNPLMGTPFENAVVFLQDKLHMDDFTHFADVYSLESDGGAFKNIKSLMENHFSLEVPQVSDPHAAVEQLKTSFSGDVHTVSSAEQVKQLNLKTGKKFLLIVQLAPVSDQKDKEFALKLNDDTVGSIAKHLQKREVKYSALFTGKSASDAGLEGIEVHGGRHLMAEPGSGNGTFMNVSGIFIFLKSARLCVRKTNSEPNCDLDFTLYPVETTADNSVAENTTARIVLDFPNATPVNINNTLYNITITQLANYSSDRWEVHHSFLDLTPSTAPADNNTLQNALLNPGDLDFIVPIMYSYHCTEMLLTVDTVKEPSNKNHTGTYVKLLGYQIQPFKVQKDRFFDAQDCVGFFSGPIWMALFCSAILLIILLFGTLMLLNLSVMDKFDDPKGKTISVAQASE